MAATSDIPEVGEVLPPVPAGVPSLDPERLQILKEIAAGGTATIFAARFNGRLVAVKSMDWEVDSMGIEEQRAFNRECDFLATLRHPNIIRLEGILSTARPLRFALELCMGGSLFQLLHDSKQVELTWRQRLKMCVDTSRALMHLHEQAPMLLHRDVKSLNLLLAQPCVQSEDIPLVKLADFGLSRRMEVEETSQQTAAAGPGPACSRGALMTAGVGSLFWTAPEVLCGKAYSDTADMYSFGIVVYEVMSRTLPYAGEEDLDIGRMVLRGHRPCLARLPADYPQVLFDIMVTCWCKASGKRPRAWATVLLLEGALRSA